MVNNIAISSMAFSALSIEEVIDISVKNNWSLEFSSGLPYRPNMIEIFINAPLKKYIHNYFPAPEEPFVVNLASSNKTVLKKSVEHARQGLKLAQQAKCGFYSVHAGFCIDPQEKELGEVFEKKGDFNRWEHIGIFNNSLQELLVTADDLKVDLYIENNVVIKENLELYGQNPFLCADFEEMIDVINELNHPRLKLLLDTAHLKVSANTISFDLKEAVQKLQPYIGAIHHSDNSGFRDTNMPLTEDYWFLRYMERFKEIVHVLEVKDLSLNHIKNQFTILTNDKRYSAITR